MLYRDILGARRMPRMISIFFDKRLSEMCYVQLKMTAERGRKWLLVHAPASFTHIVSSHGRIEEASMMDDISFCTDNA